MLLPDDFDREALIPGRVEHFKRPVRWLRNPVHGE